MFKLVTPPGLLLATSVFAIYAITAAQIARIEHSWPIAVAACVSAVACIGTAYIQPWSRYLVYLLTATFAAKWCWSVYEGYRAGFISLQVRNAAREVFWSLAPGFAMVALSAVCSWLVYRYFDRADRDMAPSSEPGS